MRYQILSSQLFSVIGFFFQFSRDIKPQHLCRLHFRSKLNPFWNAAHIFQQAPFNTQLPWCNGALSILSVRLCGVESVWYEDPQFSLLLRKVKKSPRQRAAAHFINVSAQPRNKTAALPVEDHLNRSDSEKSPTCRVKTKRVHHSATDGLASGVKRQ